jgi:hypothetical protein
MNPVCRVLAVLLTFGSLSFASSPDSLPAPPRPSLVLFPEYYMRFDLSTFALQSDAFYRRQYLAEEHPDMEFYFLSYKNLIAWVWDVDVVVGLGEVPGNNVFTVLNISWTYDPTLEVRLHDVWLTGGLTHHCLHDVDRKDFPVAYWNRVHLDASSPNVRTNTYWHTLAADGNFSQRNRVAWQVTGGYYLKQFFGLVDPYKIDGYNSFVWEAIGMCRYAFFKRWGWIFGLRGETMAGNFSRDEGFRVSSGTDWYWRETAGLEVSYVGGRRGACLYVLYNLDDMPADPNDPSFTLGHSRFSKNGLLQIGVTLFN